MKTESRESFSLQESMHRYIPQYTPNQPQQAIRKVEWEYSNSLHTARLARGGLGKCMGGKSGPGIAVERGKRTRFYDNILF